jgi:hypothetical protein
MSGKEFEDIVPRDYRDAVRGGSEADSLLYLVNSCFGDLATGSKLADRDSSQDSRNGIMADNGRKNRPFVFWFLDATDFINSFASMGCVAELSQKAKIIMSQSHLFS